MEIWILILNLNRILYKAQAYCSYPTKEEILIDSEGFQCWTLSIYLRIIYGYRILEK